MKKLNFLFCLSFIYFSAIAQQTLQNAGSQHAKNSLSDWTIQTSGTSFDLTSVCFADVNTGYAVGDQGTILNTTNGGMNWSGQASGTSYKLYSVYFLNADTGFAVGGSYNILGGNRVILKTTDGGNTWTSQVQLATPILFSVHFPDPDTGYASGGIYGVNVYVLKTIDGGNQWFELGQCNFSDINSIFFTSANKGVGVGYEGTIIKTTNGGTVWTCNTSVTSSTLHSVCFPSTDTGYAVGDAGRIIKTTNGGQTWSVQNSGTTKQLNSVSFPDAWTGYAVGSGGTILKTFNGGIIWNTLAGVSTLDLNSVSFIDQDTGYVAGNSGIILKTTNGGGLSPMLTVVPSIDTVSSSAGVSVFSVLSNTSWVAVSDAPWCTVTPSGAGNGILTATYLKNDSISSRVAHITLTASGLSPVTATLVQAGRPFKKLYVVLLLEGLFDTISNTMRQAMDADSAGNTWPKFGGTTADTLSVLLADSASPFGFVCQSHALDLDTNGSVTADIHPDYNGSYYIIIKHRNSIETWSSTPVSFSSDTIYYDFTTAANGAYRDNLLEINGVFAIYCGDINQDGSVDLEDMILVDCDATAHESGYRVTDVNGDAFVYEDDMMLVAKNAGLFIQACHP